MKGGSIVVRYEWSAAIPGTGFHAKLWRPLRPRFHFLHCSSELEILQAKHILLNTMLAEPKEMV